MTLADCGWHQVRYLKDLRISDHNNEQMASLIVQPLEVRQSGRV